MKSQENKSTIGIVSFASGEEFTYDDPAEYIQTIKDELPYRATTGFRYKTLTDDPEIRSAVDALVYDLYGEEQPKQKATDMAGVKVVAQMLLFQDISETQFSPAVVQHPFTMSGIAACNTENGIQMLNLCESEEDLALWRSKMSDAIDAANKPFDIYIRLSSPYTLTFLKYAEPYLSKQDFSEMLGHAWISSEFANNDAEVSRKQLVGMFKRSDPSSLMDEAEREQLAALDDTITVYRGVTSINNKNLRALSWTLDYETADWFAHRFKEDGAVYEAQIDKKHIFALFNGRNESEIVLDPKYLKDIAPAQIQDIGMDLSM